MRTRIGSLWLAALSLLVALVAVRADKDEKAKTDGFVSDFTVEKADLSPTGRNLLHPGTGLRPVLEKGTSG
jgi:hypothetical protein